MQITAEYVLSPEMLVILGKQIISVKMQFVYVEIKFIGNNTAISCKSKKTLKYCKILL